MWRAGINSNINNVRFVFLTCFRLLLLGAYAMIALCQHANFIRIRVCVVGSFCLHCTLVLFNFCVFSCFVDCFFVLGVVFFVVFCFVKF